MKYRPEIDGLRAVAVLPVVFFHAGFDAFEGGYVGVDVFFVISGYLITSMIVEEVQQKRFSVARFYERRARRLLPALLLVCVACVPFAWIWMSPMQFKDFSESLIAVVAFASNILFWREAGYFEQAVELKPLLHTWSLAVEEQFYLLMPLLLLSFQRLSLRALTTVLALISLASLGLSAYASGHHPSANFYLLPTRAWELGVGGLLALTGLSATPGTVLSRSGATLGVLLIGTAVFTFTDQTPFPGLYALLPVFGAALVIMHASSDLVIGPILRSRACVAIGLLSYSLYLWHQPVLAFIRVRWGQDIGEVVAFFAILLSFGLAILSWKFVEVPFRDKSQVSSRRFAGAAASLAVAVVAMGIAGHVTEGFAEATEQRSAAYRLESRLVGNYGLSPSCEDSFTLSPECRTEGLPEIAVWGDSFSMHLMQGLIASAPGVGIIQFTKSSCGPMLDVSPVIAGFPVTWPESCLSFNQQVWRWLKQNNSIKYVVLSLALSNYVDAGRRVYTREGVRPADLDFTAERLLQTLQGLEKLGVVPVVVSPPPSTGSDLGRCLFRREHAQLALQACDFERKDYLAAHHAAQELLARVDEKYHVIWLEEGICVGERCMASLDGIFLYRDNGHLSHEGSALLGQRMGWYSRLESMD